MTDEEFVSTLQSALGRARADITMAVFAISGSRIEGEVRTGLLFAAAELIDKTQGELSVIAARLAAERNVPPLPVPGPGRQS